MPSSFFGWIGFLLKEYGPLFVEGTINTIIIAVVGTLIGFLIGLLIAIVRTTKVNKKSSAFKRVGLKILNVIISIYIQVIRGTPMMVQAILIFYGAKQFLSIDMSTMLAAFIIVSINTGAYLSEVVRGGINSVDKGEIEAARSLGLSYEKTAKLVVIPQAMKNSLPALGNEVITLFKETSISGFIGLVDLTRGAGIIISRTFSAAIPYFAAALIYLLVVLLLEKIFKKLEERMAHD